MNGFLRQRAWAVLCALILASIFTFTALAGSGTVSGGTTLTYTAAPGEANDVTVSVVGGNLAIADTAGVTPTATCTLGLTGLDCGPVSSLTGPMTINTGNGNDRVTIGSSVSSPIPSIIVDGGTGNDTITNLSNVPTTASYASSLNGVSVDLSLTGAQNTGDGSDTLSGVQNLTGSSFDDTLTGNGADNTLAGGAGNDTLDGSGGNDMLVGGAGSNTASYASAFGGVNVDLNVLIGQPVGGGDGIDTLSGISNLSGSSFDDTLTGDSNANTIDGGAGNDTIAGGGGADTLNGGDGDDSITQTSSTGTTENGGAGNDSLTGLGAGTLNGGDGNDNIIQTGSTGATENGGAGDDALFGGSGNDTLAGGAGSDQLNGLAGTDTVSYADAPAGVTVNLTAGTADDGQGGSDTLTSVENVLGSAFNDTISGDSGNNGIDGGAGVNTVSYSGTTIPTPASDGVSVDLVAGTATPIGGASSGNDGLANIQNVVGSAGADTFVGNSSNNNLNGGPGNDTVTYAGTTASAPADGVRVNLGAGTASAIGSNDAGSDTLSNVENVTGSAFADSLTGNSSDNVLTGSAGNDTFGFSAGSDTYDGGTGTNNADFSADPNGVALNLGTVDTLQPIDGSNNVELVSVAGSSSIQNVTGSAQADQLTGDGQQNTLSGGGGSDTINGAGDNDTVNGDAGNDVLAGGAGDDSVNGGDGSDTLSGNAGSDALDGGAGVNTANYGAAASAVNVNLRASTASADGDGGSDTLSGIQNVTGPSIAGNLLQGDAGNNVLDGGGASGATVSYSGAASGVNVDLGAGTATGDGNDTLIGGFVAVTGSSFGDTLTAAPSGSTLNGGAGNDTLNGGAGSDTLNGGEGNDAVAGGPGSDTISGGSGDDSLSGGSGFNFLDGGIGTDTADYSGATSVASASLPGAVAVSSWPAPGLDTLANLENITGSPGNDALVGDGGDNVLRGLGGNDFLQGGAGDDSLQGGSGNDTADFQDSSGGVSVDLVAQTALGDGTDALSLIENANGSNFADQLSGNGGPNTLNGNGGNDQIDGGGGADTIDAGLGDDSVYAKDGFADTIACGGGNDTATVDAVDVVNADCEIAGFLGGPVVKTNEASGVTTTGATLNGSVNPDGRAGHYFFRFGPTSAYGQTTSSVALAAGHANVPVTAVLTGLTPGSVYHYQLVFTDNLLNTTTGSDQSFTTGTSLVGPLAVTLLAGPGDPPGNTAVLYGRVTTNGTPTTWYFEYGPTTAYGQQTPATWLGATSTSPQVFTQVSLKPSQKTWHFRLVATNGAGTSIGADQPFSTPLQMSLRTARYARRSARHGLRAHGPRRHR